MVLICGSMSADAYVLPSKFSGSLLFRNLKLIIYLGAYSYGALNYVLAADFEKFVVVL